MKLFIIAGILTVAGTACHQVEQIPQVVCTGGKAVWVDPTLETFRFGTTANGTKYEIVAEDLFIDPPERSRYLYNKVTTVGGADWNRFHSAHFTLIFSEDRQRLTLIHSNEQAVKVISTTCTVKR